MAKSRHKKHALWFLICFCFQLPWKLYTYPWSSLSHCHFRIWTQRVTLETWEPSGKKTKRQKDKKKKIVKDKDKYKVFNHVMSGQFHSLAMFSSGLSLALKVLLIFLGIILFVETPPLTTFSKSPSSLAEKHWPLISIKVAWKRLRRRRFRQMLQRNVCCFHHVELKLNQVLDGATPPCKW